MAQKPLRLIIGGKWSSTWTMRGWLAVMLSGLPFEEETLFLSRPDSKARLAEVSPTGRIPVLIDGAVRITDTLAIAEYLWELAPHSAIWPQDRLARAAARMVSAEMHAHFNDVRAALPMNLIKRWPIRDGLPSTVKLLDRPGVRADIARVEAVWRETRKTWGAGGPYLFGAEFCFADAMFAPMASRFVTYSVPMAADTADYVEACLHHPYVAQWRAGAEAQADDIGRDLVAAFP
ncbi:MAG: glutathione S-transferase [Alphaproteobacteria bacterium]|nr:MAG: glutathione S-transferase [Alphaproteobacteria bacterium]